MQATIAQRSMASRRGRRTVSAAPRGPYRACVRRSSGWTTSIRRLRAGMSSRSSRGGATLRRSSSAASAPPPISVDRGQRERALQRDQRIDQRVVDVGQPRRRQRAADEQRRAGDLPDHRPPWQAEKAQRRRAAGGAAGRTAAPPARCRRRSCRHRRSAKRRMRGVACQPPVRWRRAGAAPRRATGTTSTTRANWQYATARGDRSRRSIGGLVGVGSAADACAAGCPI